MGFLKKTINLIFIFLFFSCEKVEPFSLVRTEFNTNEVLTNGYFYFIEDNKYKVFFLNKNGVYVYLESFEPVSNNLDFEAVLKSTIKIINENKVAYHYGVFKISKNQIKIERWLSGTGGAYPIQILNGEVINDSTIKILQKIGDYKYKKSNKPIFNVNETYHFRPFSPKPDSTNKFIK